MGHTHYFSFNKAPRGHAARVEKTYQKAVKECAKVVRHYSDTFGGLSGYSAHSDQYAGITFNGSKRVGSCEDFILREHYSENETSFCKTLQLPYDTVVTACLIVLKHRLGDLIEVNSDGRRDDWNDGLTLAQNVLGLKGLAIPESIEPNHVLKVESIFPVRRFKKDIQGRAV